MKLPDPASQPTDTNNLTIPKSVVGSVVAVVLCVLFYVSYVWLKPTQSDTPKTVTLEDQAVTIHEPTAVVSATGLPPASPPISTENSGVASNPGQTIEVRVSGRVFRPGVYHCAVGTRVQEALAAAGGTLSDADLDKVNLTAPLQNGAQIDIPAKIYKSAPPDTPPAPTSIATSSKAPMAPVNLNSASEQELEGLPEIGTVLARRIIEYREKNGAFKTIEELNAVKGIGTSTVEVLRPLVTVG